jgi:hypothetical protein
MGNRREQRTKIALPVKVQTRDAENRPLNEMACTLDISPRGARLTGVRSVRDAGEVLCLERGKKKAFYSVIWIGTKQEGRDGQVGLQCVEQDVSIWGVELLPGEDERYEKMKQSDAERRKNARFPCPGTVHIFQDGKAEPSFGDLAEISCAGCYIRMASPPASGIRIRLAFKIPAHQMEFSLRGSVLSSQRAMGMAVNFLEIAPEAKSAFEALLKRLQETAAVSGAAAATKS